MPTGCCTLHGTRENYAHVFTDPDVSNHISFGRYYFNSLFVAAWVTFLTCLTSAMAAYAFARLRWRGRDTVFLRTSRR
jgi:ABC-type glycerol-3-phosphate transport system permease component